VKVGRKKKKPPGGKGKMSTAYFWPLYGDQDEVAFHFSPTRSHSVVFEMLGGYAGTLITDVMKPTEKRQAKRALHCKPIVEDFFEWLRDLQAKQALLPTSPFTKALAYALEREKELKVFLENPDVPLDTNHLERQIRPIAVGRKNWLFCWTEVGAKYTGVAQSLISTCVLHGVDPFTYLVDVLQRLETHPATKVHELTPRLWKEKFSENPIPATLDPAVCQHGAG